jgi:hypothetical protein
LKAKGEDIPRKINAARQALAARQPQGNAIFKDGTLVVSFFSQLRSSLTALTIFLCIRLTRFVRKERDRQERVHKATYGYIVPLPRSDK